MENDKPLTGSAKAWATKRANRAARNTPFKKEVVAQQKAEQATRLRNLLEAWVKLAEEPPAAPEGPTVCARCRADQRMRAMHRRGKAGTEETGWTPKGCLKNRSGVLHWQVLDARKVKNDVEHDSKPRILRIARLH